MARGGWKKLGGEVEDEVEGAAGLGFVAAGVGPGVDFGLKSNAYQAVADCGCDRPAKKVEESPGVLYIETTTR